MAKYQYVKVIQFGQYGKWSDESTYETGSDFTFPNKEARAVFKADLAEYKRAAKSAGGQTRVVQRRIPNQ